MLVFALFLHLLTLLHQIIMLITLVFEVNNRVKLFQSNKNLHNPSKMAWIKLKNYIKLKKIVIKLWVFEVRNDKWSVKRFLQEEERLVVVMWLIHSWLWLLLETFKSLKNSNEKCRGMTKQLCAKLLSYMKEGEQYGGWK